MVSKCGLGGGMHNLHVLKLLYLRSGWERTFGIELIEDPFTLCTTHKIHVLGASFSLSGAFRPKFQRNGNYS